MARGRVIYVGSTLDLYERVRSHWSITRNRSNYGDPPTPQQSGFVGIAPDEITIRVKPARRVGEWLYREYRLIHRLRPAYNYEGVRRGALVSRKVAS